MTCFLFASWHLIVSTGIFSFVFMLTSHFRLFFKKPDNLRKGTLTSIPPPYIIIMLLLLLLNVCNQTVTSHYYISESISRNLMCLFLSLSV